MIKPTDAKVEFNKDTQEMEVFFTYPNDKCSLQYIPATEHLLYKQDLLQRLCDICIHGVRE